MSGLYRYRTVQQFRDDLDFFLRHYTPVSEDDVIAYLHHGRNLPERAVLLTFDDGFRELYEIVAPILRAKGAPAIFFLITSTVDNQSLCHPQKASLLIHAVGRAQSPAVLEEVSRLLPPAAVPGAGSLKARIGAVTYAQRALLDEVGEVLNVDFGSYLGTRRPFMTSDEVCDLLRQGFAVGAHSVDHPPYADLRLDEQLDQTRQSVRWIAERFKIPCRSFAFPYRDDGVSSGFFRALLADRDVCVSFGTSGLIPHSECPSNLPRFSTEREHLTASRVLAFHFARYFVHEGPWRPARRRVRTLPASE